MAGADSKMKALIASLRRLPAFEREVRLRALADTYGAGFADVVRRELATLDGKAARS